jgi:light-regulated signal transduction histidine kinase (bacteriophytochrome)/CheY-like chemotaxis protein
MTDLTTCDREPIHIPGAIFPYGALLVLNGVDFKVLQAAGATQELLGASIDAPMGQPAERLFTPEQMDRLRGLADEPELIKPRHLLDPLLRVSSGAPLDASVHRVDGALILEFEAADISDAFAAEPLAAVQLMVEDFAAAASLYKLCQLATESVRRVAPYDRVMIYRFMEDGSGWVIAESRDAKLAPFLDLHYPAADIPQQARALYLKSWLRLIARVDYDPAPLIPELNPETGKPLDMSYAVLRDVSPIHREYLRNMGVDASMSISIIVGGKLWGLIACHHDSPRQLPRHLRAVCELFGSIFSLQIEAREKAEQFESRLASRKVLQKLMLNLANVEDYALGLTQQSPNLLDHIHGGPLSPEGKSLGGVAVRVDGALTFLGVTPSAAEIGVLCDWLTTHMSESEGVFSTDRLGEIWAPAKAFATHGAGLLVISVSRDPSDLILWFRPELVETTSWAGDPAKSVLSGATPDRLLPRKSFDVWKQTVRGRAIAWTPAELDAALDLRVSLIQVILRRIEVATRERAKAHDRDKLMMAELDHRVKNTLANIQALVMHSSRHAESLTSFVDGLDKRLHAMAKAHSLLTQSRWEGVSIDRLVREELEPYSQAGANVAFGGPDVVLTSKSALALSLALHELATNAAKFGALSKSSGRIDISWRMNDVDGGLALTWRESGGPAVDPPKRRGFGSNLIERALALETGGVAKIRYERGGVVCEVLLPPTSLLTISDISSEVRVEEGVRFEPPPQAARRARVLFVDDSYLLIITLEEMCEELGWEVVGPATRLAQALHLARTELFDAALLDVNLDGEMSWEVALVLQARGIPFVFSSGYDGASILPAALAGAQVLRKPFRVEDIVSCIRKMLASRSSEAAAQTDA